MTSLGDVSVKYIDSVAIVTLERPERHNAITQNMRERLLGHFSELAKDNAVRAVILTGAGQVSFCAGTDVTEFSGRSGIDQWRRDINPLRIFEVIERFPKPVVAMVNGYAFGGGCELALACDFRVAGDSAQFGQLEINFGLIPGGGGTQRLTRLVGKGNAMRLILSGEKINAAEALRIGLVEYLCPQQDLTETTIKIVERIARHDPLALELAKAAISSVDELPLSSGLKYEASLMGIGLSAGSQEEKIKEFANKKPGTK